MSVDGVHKGFGTAWFQRVSVEHLHLFNSRSTCRARAGVAPRLAPATPPPINAPSLQLQTLAARSRALIHCIRLRLEEAQSNSAKHSSGNH